MGDVHGGHYCAFLRPHKENKWFKFDDDRVVPVADKEVLEDNYGGDVGIVLPNTRQSRLHKKFTNAYMLVYIRESDLDNVLSPVTAADIPSHLRKLVAILHSKHKVSLFCT
jgi:ubiquitin carboxyl-terminal hydrolase 7